MSIQTTIDDVRKRIEKIDKTKIRMALKYQYETGTRISEVAGLYAINKEDLTLTKYKDKTITLFSQKTAKKKGRIRIIALPLESDPWVQEIVDYFQTIKKGKVFKVSDRTLEIYAKKFFSGITYLIEDYTIHQEGKVIEHEKQAVTHYLRKLRHTYLMVIKGFSESERNIFFGWTTPGMGKRYMIDLWLQWSTYIDKLF